MSIDIKNAPFHPEWHGDTLEAETIRKSNLWNIVLSLHFNINKKLYVCGLTISEDKSISINMRDIQGANILALDRKGEQGEITIRLSISKIINNWQKPLISSHSVKYIMGKLNQGEAISGRIKHWVDLSEREFLPDLLQVPLSLFTNNQRPRNAPYSQLSTEESEVALRLLCGGIDPATQHAATIAQLKNRYSKLDEWDKKMLEYKTSFNTMFLREKYLLVYTAHVNPIIAGEINIQSLHEDGNNLVLKDTLLPLRIYMTPESIPAEIQGALAWWKVVRESREKETKKVITCLDPNKFLPNVTHIDKELGVIVSGDQGKYAVYLIDKPGVT